MLFLLLSAYSIILLSAKPIIAQDSLLNIIIVAGQSNALNWHADATQLDTATIDKKIPFYFDTGLPPDRGFEIPFNATSDSSWVGLSYQRQQPFIKYFPAFFGPEITLAEDLAQQIPNLAVFKCTYGGSNLALDWDKGNDSGNQLYDRMIGEFKHATNVLDSSKIDYKVVGFFWMQGESDAANNGFAANYENNLKSLIQNSRNDFQNASLPIVLGRINAHLPAPYLYKDQVIAAQMKVAEEDPLVSWVSIDDQVLDTDEIHLLAEGVKVLGNRMAKAWLNQVSTEIEERKAAFPKADFSLKNFPNPFNPTTTIQFTLAESRFITIKIYDMLGREMETLAASVYSSGRHSVLFDATNYATGSYIYEIQNGNSREQKLMSFIK